MTEILRTGGAFLSLRCEGPHELPQKRPLALVSILPCLAAAEIANALHLRDFRSPAIFEFFNTIRRQRTSPTRFGDGQFRTAFCRAVAAACWETSELASSQVAILTAASA